MYWVYSALLAVGLLVSLPYWLLQAATKGKYRAGLAERLGRVPGRLRPSGQPVIWIHAVSVGEALAVSGLVAKIKRRWPQHRVLVSTTTDTGQKLARRRFGEDNVFYFPLDFGFAVRPYLRALRPELIVIAETEFWPNFLRLAAESGARIAVANGRISDRSERGYLRWRVFLRRILRRVDIFLAQSEEDRRRLVAIGAEAGRVRVSGNLKFDATLPPEPAIVGRLRQALQQEEAGPVLVCGSTADGEEQVLAESFAEVLASYPRAVMLLAPRHPERFSGVAQTLMQSGTPFMLRSHWNGEALAGKILLVDSIGELASLYGLGDLAFVGGSLVPRGGHNILEPALHGLPIVVGPHTENFRDVVGLFQRKDAVRVAEVGKLARIFLGLLADKSEREGLGRRAAETAAAEKGATQITMQALEALLAANSAAPAPEITRRESEQAASSS
ncbi:MAG TPA: 3-deoxy-D-manno-octulosonic acid transferase [Terriglobales bacterium]|nr:3-deoxy-D-manno-octulosonic acid transferase [Terriglobales bacterium]